MRPGLLVTADGTVFSGRLVGGPGTAPGELVFNTSMTGYQEVITDPSYTGQIVVMTSPHIGVYGVSDDDRQSEQPALAGLVVRDLSPGVRSDRGDLGGYLDRHRVPVLTEVDTRALTRLVRTRGAMPAAIGPASQERELKRLARSTPVMEGLGLAEAVGTAARYTIRPEADARARVVAVDFGVKRDMLSRMTARGWEIEVVPNHWSSDQVLALEPDGVFLSNGPGDPAPLRGAVQTIQTLLGQVPVFGICLGHQLVGRALGAATFKLRFGHHGGNHPVRRLADGAVTITAHNHGFAVDLWSLTEASPSEPEGLPTPELLPASVESRYGWVEPTHQNLYDGTLEGLACRDVPALSVQYHPEAAPGPHDALGLFATFEQLMGVR